MPKKLFGLILSILIISGSFAAEALAQASTPAPTGVNATSGENGRVTISWNPPSTSAAIDRYKIYRTDGWSANAGGGDRSYTNGGLTNGTRYCYYVTAFIASVESGHSNTACGKPYTVPSSPDDFVGSFDQDDPDNFQINLSWGAPASDGGSEITGYKIYKRTDSGAENLLTTLAASSRSFTDSDIDQIDDHTYYFLITATNAAGEGPRAQELAVATTGGDDVSDDCSPGLRGIFCRIGKLFELVGNLPNVLKNLLLWVADSIVKLIVGVLVSVIAFIGSYLIKLAAGILNIAIGLNDTITYADSLAHEGWRVVLEIANVGFAIMIVIIGFATILRKADYAIQRALPRLIVVAVLINFTLFFADKLILLSNDLTWVFSQAISSGSWDTLIPGGNPLGNISVPSVTDNGTSGLASIIATAILPLFVTFFTFIAAFAIFAAAVMFLVRYVVLTILVIIMPLALLTAIFPNLEVGGGWHKWTETFTKWLIFGPVAMFFIWLAMTKMGTLDIQSGVGVIGEMLAKMGIIIGGLMIANELGFKGGAWATKMAGVATRRVAAGGVSGAKFLGKARQTYKAVNDPAAQAMRGMLGGPTKIGFGTVLQGELKKSGEKTLLGRAMKRSEEQKTKGYTGGPRGFKQILGDEIHQTEAYKKVAHMPGALVHGFEHWAEGGPSLKGTWKEGKAQFKKMFGGDLAHHGPMEGLLGHSKSEQYEQKIGKALKFLEKKQAEEYKFLNTLVGLTDKQIKDFRLMTDKAKADYIKTDIMPKLTTKESQLEFNRLRTTITSTEGIIGSLNRRLVEETEGLSDIKSEAGHGSPIIGLKKKSGGGGGH